jgi:hypothetical protein
MSQPYVGQWRREQIIIIKIKTRNQHFLAFGKNHPMKNVVEKHLHDKGVN